MRKFSFGAAAGALVLTGLTFGALDASAAGGITIDAAGLRQAVVHVDQFNLATRHGTETLYRQIRYAAERVCSVDGGRESLRVKAQVRDCERAAIARAVEQVDVPSLYALHQVRMERSARG
ncbi:MAG: UrcA family protein [Pseudomonadales bacterium]|jgi:UrcA family protein|nr:UrcA family protein [Pseudomonadales bacterium]